MKADFRRKEPESNASECVVEKTIVLPEAEYQYFAKHLLRDYDFIRDNRELMYERDDVWHCLLVAGKDSHEGILVESEGSNYARYSALMPDASNYMKQYPKALFELGELAEEIAWELVEEGVHNTTNGAWIAKHDEWIRHGTMDYALKDLIRELLCSREEVLEINELEEGFEVAYDTKYCPNVEEGEEIPGENVTESETENAAMEQEQTTQGMQM